MAADAAYTDFLKRKLVKWYSTASKSDSHAPSQEENDGEVTQRSPRQGKRRRGMRGCESGVLDAFNFLINHRNLISKPKRTYRQLGQAAAAQGGYRGAFELNRGQF